MAPLQGTAFTATALRLGSRSHISGRRAQAVFTPQNRVACVQALQENALGENYPFTDYAAASQAEGDHDLQATIRGNQEHEWRMKRDVYAFVQEPDSADEG
jgi:hypothetical protein